MAEIEENALEGFEDEAVNEADIHALTAELGAGEPLFQDPGAEPAEEMDEEEEDTGLIEEEEEVEDQGLEEALPEEAGEEQFDLVDEEGLDVQEHLKDAVEGSLRLKRLLSRDEDADEPGKKRAKLDGDADKKVGKVKQMLAKWQLANDAVVKHVLESCSLTELEDVGKSNFMPDKFNMWKSPAEILARYISEMKERKMPGGSVLDSISAFKFRHKLDFSADKKLRALSHKDLRFVLTNFDGTAPLDDVIAEASATESIEDSATTNAFPEGPGISTIGRFARLELIDPLADCAIFGEANLTFALKLAKHRQALGHVGRVIATTFEELDTLRERYKEIDSSIKELEGMCAEVYHGVDCTRIALDPRFQGMEGALGAVYYNFPHSGAIQGFFDGHPLVNWRHENLMRLFFRALRSFVKPGGIVKVASNMGAVGVRYSYIVGGALENEFMHVETVPFLEWHLHRYGRSYGDKRDVYKRPDAKNNQSYNAQAADRDMVYCFAYNPTGETLGKQEMRLPPTLKTLKSCSDGPFKHLQGMGKENLAKQLHKRFVTEVSGVHVG